MNAEQSRDHLHRQHELERAMHARNEKLKAHEREIRGRERERAREDERRRVAELLGPGDGVEDDWGVT